MRHSILFFFKGTRNHKFFAKLKVRLNFFHVDSFLSIIYQDIFIALRLEKFKFMQKIAKL